MKYGTLTCITTITSFAALVAPMRVAAQKQQQSKPQPRYKLVDIGTFGGPASFINPPFNVNPELNRRGMAAGASATSIPTTSSTNFFVCGGLDGIVQFVFHAFKSHHGVTTNLGALPSQANNCSNALAINAAGDIVVGASENGVIDPLLGITEMRAVLWEGGNITDLGTLGGNHSVANSINNQGQVTGFALNTIPDPFSMLYFQAFGSSNGTQTRAFLSQHGQMQDLGTLGGPDAFGSFINERGQVAGFSFTNSTPNATTGFPTEDPFRWENGTMLDLGSLGGTFGNPTALNNRGNVIGFSNLAGDQSSHPFLWSQGKLIDLYTNTAGGNPLSADAINDAGEIVGAATFPAQAYDAYLRRGGVATDLGHLNGDCTSEAWAINAIGQVAGISFACDGVTARAFLWENGSLVDLNTLIPGGSSLQLVWPMAINDRGEIDGVGNPPGCSNSGLCGHAFVLIPCGEGDAGCADGAAAPATQSSTTANPALGRPSGMLNGLRGRRFPGLRSPGPAGGPTR